MHEVDAETAVDLMRLLMAPDHYHRLVTGCGWSPERFRVWLAGQARALLGPVRR